MENLKVLQIETWRSEFSEDKCNFDEVEKYLDFIKESADHYDPERYSEWHHVMPKCIDKDHKYNDECVRINGADHFRAHLKLVDCLNSKRYKYLLSKPTVQMTSFRLEGEVTPEEVEESKRKFSESQSGENNPTKREEVRNKIRDSHLNMSQEQRKKISESHADFNGENNPFYGRHHTEESINKMKSHLPNRSGENNAFYGMQHSEDTKEKLRKPKTEEHRRKISENRKGTVYITNGTVNKFIRKDDPVPEGFRYGRTVKRRKEVLSVE